MFFSRIENISSPYFQLKSMYSADFEFLAFSFLTSSLSSDRKKKWEILVNKYFVKTSKNKIKLNNMITKILSRLNPLTANDEISRHENLTFLWTWILRWVPRSFATSTLSVQNFLGIYFREFIILQELN